MRLQGSRDYTSRNRFGANLAMTTLHGPLFARLEQVMDRESGLLDWRASDGTAFLVTLWHDGSVGVTRVRVRLGIVLDWTASCSYLEASVSRVGSRTEMC